MSELVSGKNYIAECPSVGAWGVMSDVTVTKKWSNVEQTTDEAGDIDGHILSGYMQEVTANYSYLTGASNPPETALAAGTLLTLTDLSSGGQLPAKLLLTEVTFNFKKGAQATASIKGEYAAYMASLT